MNIAHERAADELTSAQAARALDAAFCTARTGRGKFYVVEDVKTTLVNGRVQLLVTFQPYESVTISMSTERVHQLLDVLERLVTT